MANKNLLSKRFAGGERPVERNIVDVLTSDDSRTSVFAPKKNGENLPRIVGVNSVSQGVPIRIRGKYDERGFVDLEDSRVIYLIDAKSKKIRAMPNEMNLFYDADKVSSDNEYVWNGTTQEILEEFRKAGYKVFDISTGLRDYSTLAKQVEDAVNGNECAPLYNAEDAVRIFEHKSCTFGDRFNAYQAMLKILSDRVENKFDEKGW